MNNPALRDGMIHNAVEARRADDTKIMAKVNAAHREGFKARFPGAIEHNMRLINERLQHCLSKAPGIDLADPESWTATTADIAALAQAIWHLEQTRLNWPSED